MKDGLVSDDVLICVAYHLLLSKWSYL